MTTAGTGTGRRCGLRHSHHGHLSCPCPRPPHRPQQPDPQLVRAVASRTPQPQPQPRSHRDWHCGAELERRGRCQTTWKWACGGGGRAATQAPSGRRRRRQQSRPGNESVTATGIVNAFAVLRAPLHCRRARERENESGTVNVNANANVTRCGGFWRSVRRLESEPVRALWKCHPCVAGVHHTHTHTHTHTCAHIHAHTYIQVGKEGIVSWRAHRRGWPQQARETQRGAHHTHGWRWRRPRLLEEPWRMSTSSVGVGAERLAEPRVVYNCMASSVSSRVGGATPVMSSHWD